MSSTSTYLKIVFILNVICFLSWPIHMKSIPSSEQNDTTPTIDLRPAYRGITRQMSQITSFVGGLFGGSWFGATSATPFIRCSCCKFLMLS